MVTLGKIQPDQNDHKDVKELINKKISDIKPDLIINVAAYNAVDKCEEDETEFGLAQKLNGTAVGYLEASDGFVTTAQSVVGYSIRMIPGY